MLASDRVNTHDPERPHIALARPAVAIRIRQRVSDGLIGRSKMTTLRPAVPFGELENLLVALATLRTAFHTWHLLLPCYLIRKPGTRVRTRRATPLLAGAMSSILRKDRFDFADFL